MTFFDYITFGIACFLVGMLTAIGLSIYTSKEEKEDEDDTDSTDE